MQDLFGRGVHGLWRPGTAQELLQLWQVVLNNYIPAGLFFVYITVGTFSDFDYWKIGLELKIANFGCMHAVDQPFLPMDAARSIAGNINFKILRWNVEF